MKLLFKERLFSWLDSYDVYDENGEAVFFVKGKLSWGHLLEIFDRSGAHVGTVKEEVLTFLPRFTFSQNGAVLGQIKKELSFFTPVFTLEYQGWEVTGDIFQWEYAVRDQRGNTIMTASKEVFNWTDTYVIDIINPADTLLSLMIVLAIDAAKCSDNK